MHSPEVWLSLSLLVVAAFLSEEEAADPEHPEHPAPPEPPAKLARPPSLPGVERRTVQGNTGECSGRERSERAREGVPFLSDRGRRVG